MGRRKIEMTMVLDSGCRQVTFSKRRTGLFKKANELATLCGAEVAVIVFSPGGKPFSFGQPTVDSVANRFLSGGAPAKITGDRVRESAAAERLNQLLNEKMRQFHEEKKRGEAIADVRGFDLESLSLEELVKLKKSLEELREMAKERLSEIEASSTLLMLSNNHDDDDGDDRDDDDEDDDDADDDDDDDDGDYDDDDESQE